MFSSNSLNKLIQWYEKNQREFPWRTNPNPYWVWIVEIMSQQTQMASVLPFFYRFIEKFPHVDNLAKAPEAEVMAAWAGLGYYSRARNLQKAAKIIQSQSAQNLFPQTYEGWLELPGVGEYTAAAVVSQAFGKAHPVWDGNVQRVCSRVNARKDVYTKTFKAEMLATLAKKIKEFNPSSFNQAFMELGATVCTPKKPQCGACPLSSECKANALGKVSDFPPPKPRKNTIQVKARSLVCVKHDKSGRTLVLMRRRKQGEWFSGLWDFRSELGGVKKPTVKIEHSEKLLAKAKEMGEITHHITHHKIALKALVSRAAVEKTAEEKWIVVDELATKDSKLPVATTAKKVFRIIARQICLNMD